VSVGSNGVRAILGFITGIGIARGLTPSGYGNLQFLLGSFIAIRSLLDMGSSNAFYTFLSRRAQGFKFYLSYMVWLALQGLITLLLVAFIIPSTVFEKIWLGHSRGIVLLALLAAFMQQQLWQMVNHIGESMRKTIRLQLLNLSVAILSLAMVSFLLVSGGLSIKNILFLMVVQYAVATSFAYWFLREDQMEPVEGGRTLKQIGQDYWVYCKPLILLSFVSFLYDFSDKWMLQKFGGATRQGYFQIASQFANVSLLATTSILGIFWKEISASFENRNEARIAFLYRKISRGLVLLAAMMTGLLFPWSEAIVIIVLGPSYAPSWPVLAIMLFYPIHQSLGQMGGILFLARGHTHTFLLLGTVFMMISVPVTYMILAPTQGIGIPGLGMGAIGLAAKMVLLGILFVNFQAWVIARYSGWTFDWAFQVIGIPLMIGSGCIAKVFVGLLWNLEVFNITNLLIPFVMACLIHAILAGGIVWRLPWLIGMEREEMKRSLMGLKKQIVTLWRD
jgi:O-antigen/teichoic acid export membrane protein